MRIEKTTFQSAGFKLTGEFVLPNRLEAPLPAVILLHGLTNSKNDCPLINETSEALVKNGLIVFRFDQYGSGESPGEMQDKTITMLEQNLKDAIEFVAKDKRVDKNKIGLWGRSLGGTLVCLIPNDKRIKARVVASPGTMFESTANKKLEELKRKEIELEKVGKKLPGTGNYKGPFDFKPEFYKSMNGLDERVFNNLRNLNTILILGTALDQKVTPENACIVMNEAKEPKRIWIYMTDHDYAGFEKEAVEETAKWFKQYLFQ